MKPQPPARPVRPARPSRRQARWQAPPGLRLGCLLCGLGRIDPQHGQHRLLRLDLLRHDWRLRRGAPGRIGGKFLVRGAQQGGRAEAEDENGDGQGDRGEQETEAGEHFWIRFRLGRTAAGALEPKGNAVITEVDQPRSPSRIRLDSRIPQALFTELLNFVAANGAGSLKRRFSAACGIAATALMEHHFLRKWAFRAA